MKKEDKKSLKEFLILFKFIKEDKIKLILASILIFLCELSSVFVGYINGVATESIIKMKLGKALIAFGIYFIGRITADGVLYICGESMLENIENRISKKLGFNAYKKALNLPAYAYEKTSSGEIINRITNDSNTLTSSFSQLLRLVSSIVGTVILLFYIFINSWIVGLEIVIFLVVIIFVLRKYNPMLKQIHKEEREVGDKFTSVVNESIRGIREIKTLGIKNNLITNIIEIIKESYNKSSTRISLRKRFNIIMNIIKSLLEVGVFITCVILLYYKKTTLTFFIAMTWYVYRYMYLIENINGFSQTYQSVVVSLSRVNELITNKLYNDETFGEEKLDKVKGFIEFKNVTFSYPEEDIILKKFNLKIEPNKKIAIVGKSGQGKSTIFNLLTRVFDPKEGEITLDNVNIKNLSEEALRNYISIIRQEPFIFNRTIKENFKLIDKKITLKDIRNYCKIAYLDDYIMSLPKKYNTKLGEGGVNLSGGQKQRLSIARTLAKKSKVVLFDEATSALDNSSQNFIKKAIDNLVKDHTVIIVAHRLSTIIDADIIYIVDKGKIVGSGKHDELLKNNKIYKNLYESEL